MKKINWLKVAEWVLTIGGFAMAGIGQVIGTRNTVVEEVNDIYENGRKKIEGGDDEES